VITVHESPCRRELIDHKTSMITDEDPLRGLLFYYDLGFSHTAHVLQSWVAGTAFWVLDILSKVSLGLSVQGAGRDNIVFMVEVVYEPPCANTNPLFLLGFGVHGSPFFVGYTNSPRLKCTTPPHFARLWFMIPAKDCREHRPTEIGSFSSVCASGKWSYPVYPRRTVPRSVYGVPSLR